ncbi:MAG: hypothetical protein AB7U82_11945 [Blastocatellales bacterium]
MTIFLILTAAGFIFLLASLLLGDLFDHLGLGVLSADAGTDSVGLLDSRVISIFLTAFGAFGAIWMSVGFGVVFSSLIGLAGGIVLGGLAFYFGKFLYHQQASSSISAPQLVGRIAEVTVTIQPGNLGQISCRVGEERVEKLARVRSDIVIKPGAVVLIEEVSDDAVIVSPYDGP